MHLRKRCPHCQTLFSPDRQHRFNGACSEICARALTKPTSAGSTSAVPIAADSSAPSIQRRHGADNREVT